MKEEKEADELVVRTEDLFFGFPGGWKLGPLNVSVNAGEIWGMVGPNGAGKTTLMETILGLRQPLSGRVLLSKKAERPAGVSYVPQRESLASVFPVSALQVVMMGLVPVRGMGRPFGKAHRCRAMESLKAVGLERLARQPFRSMSGGEQQRTLLARALVSKPAILMLDEPTSGMDVDGGRQIFRLITDQAQSGGHAVVLISHMLDDIKAHTSQVIYVHRLKGFVRTGRPTELLAEHQGPTFFGSEEESTESPG